MAKKFLIIISSLCLCAGIFLHMPTKAYGANVPVTTFPYESYNTNAIIKFSERSKITIKQNGFYQTHDTRPTWEIYDYLVFWPKDSNTNGSWYKSGNFATINTPFTVNNTKFYLVTDLSDLELKVDGGLGTDYCIAVALSGEEVGLGVNNFTHTDTIPGLGCVQWSNSALKMNVKYKIYNSKNEDVTSEFPHDLVVSDIDSGFCNDDTIVTLNDSLTKNVCSATPEAIKFEQGFDYLYLPDTYDEGHFDNTFYNSHSDYTHVYNGKDSFKYGGVWARANAKPVKSFVIQHYHSAMELNLISPLNVADFNKKLSSSSSATVGDTVSWVVELPLPTKYQDGVSPYRSLTVTDTLPKEFSLSSVDLQSHTDGNKFITKTGNYWKFAPTDDWLFDKRTGGSLKFKITATVSPKAINVESAKNCAFANFGKVLYFESCSNPVVIVKPVPSVSVEKFGNGKRPDSDKIYISGDTIMFTYKVTNTSKLEDVNITELKDTKLGVLECPKKTLKPGESMICKKSGTI